MKPTIFPLLIGLALFSCAKTNSETTAADEQTQVIEALADGSNAIGSVLDEQEGGTTIVYTPAHPLNSLLPLAHAAGKCQRAGSLTCDNSSGQGVRAKEFSCTFGRMGNRSISGNMSLSYSDTNCSMQTTGASVTRSFTRSITLPRGSMTITTDANSDYNGNSYGGGNVMTKTDSGYNLKINGRHRRKLNASGTEILSVSSRTLEDIVISGESKRANRLVASGKVEVNHNLAKFTAVYQPKDLQYRSDCCHPISGQFTVTYSGSIEGESTIEFKSCGSASITRNGETSDVSFDEEQCD